MAYSLYFWRQTRSIDESPDEICAKLCKDVPVAGVAELPIIAIREAFAHAFSGMNDGLSYLDWEGDRSYFEVHWPAGPVNMFHVSCGYELLKSPETMNRIIEIATKFGCALYDPQTEERYDQPDP